MQVKEALARDVLKSLGYKTRGRSLRELAERLNSYNSWRRSVAAPEDENVRAFLKMLGKAAQKGEEITVVREDKTDKAVAELDEDREEGYEGNGPTAEDLRREEAGPDDEDEDEDEDEDGEGDDEDGEGARAPAAARNGKAGEFGTAAHAPPEVLKNKLIPVSESLARRFKGLDTFPRDRKLKPKLKHALKAAMQAGQFYGSIWASVKVKENGKTFRVNGKHTSHAAVELYDSDTYFPEFSQWLKEFQVETMEDASRLYSLFDPKQSSRSKGDILESYAGSSEELKPTSKKVVSLCAAALAWGRWGKKYRTVSPQEQAEYMLNPENQAFVVWADELLGKRTKETAHMFRMPVVAGMLATFHVADEDVCNTFWEKIKNDSDDPKGSPTRVLHGFLLRHNVGARSHEGEKPTVSDKEMTARCVQAWNAWRSGGEKLAFAKFNPKEEVPEAV